MDSSTDWRGWSLPARTPTDEDRPILSRCPQTHVCLFLRLWEPPQFASLTNIFTSFSLYVYVTSSLCDQTTFPYFGCVTLQPTSWDLQSEKSSWQLLENIFWKYYVMTQIYVVTRLQIWHSRRMNLSPGELTGWSGWLAGLKINICISAC